MPYEFSGKREVRRVSEIVARGIGIVGITAAFLAPLAEHSPGPQEIPYKSAIVNLPLADAATGQTDLPPIYDEISGLTRDTGMDTQSCAVYDVCGTDWFQPFLLPDGDVGYLGGDTFKVKGPFLKNLPDGADEYRAQVMLRSDEMPTRGKSLTFTGAAGLEGTGPAPEFLGQWHILMNDGVSLPNGDIVVSYQHTVEVKNPQDNTWHTDRASMAISHDDGMTFEDFGPNWDNNSENSDPYQMWSMQLDGDYVYVVSVEAGRKPGPMMLFRVPWQEMNTQSGYQYWNGADWGGKDEAQPILQGHFGEPSLRKLSDGTWVMSYADYSHGPTIVTRTLLDSTTGPSGEWSQPKVQLTGRQLPNPYGGGIVPTSTADNLVLMVSTWQTKGTAKKIENRELVRYDVSHLVTTE